MWKVILSNTGPRIRNGDTYIFRFTRGDFDVDGVAIFAKSDGIVNQIL